MAASAQNNPLFEPTDAVPDSLTRPLSRSFVNYRLVRQHLDEVRALRQLALQRGGTTITIPLPDGTDAVFSLTPVETLAPELQGQFPDIRTYTGSTADGRRSLRLTLSPMGMMGTVTGPDGVSYFSPLDNIHPEVLIVYRAADVFIPATIKCLTDGAMMTGEGSGPAHRGTVSSDCVLRTYRFAIAATGEYTTWAGGQSNAIAQIANTVNNVNAIYERDFTIHLTVVSPLSNIYTDASTDPFTTVSFPTGTTLSESSTTLNANVTTANYDLGMVFNNGWNGGLASLSVVCKTGKGNGAAGLSSGTFPTGPSGSIFENTVAHEVGHQFSATHSFAANNGSCSGNTTGATGWEPGGGSTIMAYAGSCSGNSYQNNTDNYFHGGNIAQVLTYKTTNSTCGTASASGNTAPVASVAAISYDIPNSTPFALTVSSTDANSDALTYCWEELDAIGGSGTASTPSSTAVTGPQFRSYYPVSTPTRYFPSLDVLTGGTSATYEVLPSVARALNFRETTRDNHSGGGCTAYQDVTVNTKSCGPFAITNFTGATALVADGTTTTTLNWNTASACVSTATINILFSTDGGKSFPYTIASNVANDGGETFIVPNLPTCNGRFMIQAMGNIYFNISSGAVTITSGCGANGATFSPSSAFSAANAGDASLDLTEAPDYGTQITGAISGSIASTDPAGNLSFADGAGNTCNGPSNANNYDTVVLYPSVTGTYTFTSTTSGLVMNLYSNSYQPKSVCSNFISSSATRPSGTGGVGLSNTVSASLCARTRYVLLISSFNTVTGQPTAYSITVTPPAGGALYNGSPAPMGFNYCYAVVRNSTNNVVAVSGDPDLSNSTSYPNGAYTLYGISSSTACTNLNTAYAGGSYSTLRQDLLNQNALCGQQSSNSRAVTIGSIVALPLRLLDFTAKMVRPGTVSTQWEAASESAIAGYRLERSTDGKTFGSITLIAGRNRNLPAAESYTYLDEQLPAGAATLYYRLRIESTGGGAEYSAVVPVRLQEAGSAVTLYPNPLRSGPLTTLITTSAGEEGMVTVTDLSGRLLLQQPVALRAGVNRVELPVGMLAAGMYLVKASWGNGYGATMKFIRE